MTRQVKKSTVPTMFTNRNISFDCDLAQFPGSGKSRRGTPNYKYALVCCDRFSFKIFAQPVVNKKSTTVSKALQRIIRSQNDNVWPAQLRTDRVCIYYLLIHFQLFTFCIFQNFRVPNFLVSHFEIH